MIAYQYNHAGYWIGTTEADPSPLEPGKYLVPARCTLTEPPHEFPDGKWPRWNGASWDLVNVPAVVKPSIMERLKAALKALAG